MRVWEQVYYLVDVCVFGNRCVWVQVLAGVWVQVCTSGRTFVYIMELPNSFLANENHGATCCCVNCFHRKISNTARQYRTARQLQRQFSSVMMEDEEARKDAQFRQTMNWIAHGMAYRAKCLRPHTRYTTYGCWLRDQPFFNNLSDEQYEYMCKSMTEVSGIVKKWDTIRYNLMNPTISRNIDCRGFSINQFYRAQNPAFCQRYNRIHGNEPPPPPVIQTYDEVLYQGIRQHIQDSTILQLTGYDPAQAELISSRLKRDLTRFCMPN